MNLRSGKKKRRPTDSLSRGLGKRQRRAGSFIKISASVSGAETTDDDYNSDEFSSSSMDRSNIDTNNNNNNSNDVHVQSLDVNVNADADADADNTNNGVKNISEFEVEALGLKQIGQIDEQMANNIIPTPDTTKDTKDSTINSISNTTNEVNVTTEDEGPMISNSHNNTSANTNTNNINTNTNTTTSVQPPAPVTLPSISTLRLPPYNGTANQNNKQNKQINITTIPFASPLPVTIRMRDFATPGPPPLPPPPPIPARTSSSISTTPNNPNPNDHNTHRPPTFPPSSAVLPMQLLPNLKGRRRMTNGDVGEKDRGSDNGAAMATTGVLLHARTTPTPPSRHVRSHASFRRHTQEQLLSNQRKLDLLLRKGAPSNGGEVVAPPSIVGNGKENGQRTDVFQNGHADDEVDAQDKKEKQKKNKENEEELVPPALRILKFALWQRTGTWVVIFLLLHLALLTTKTTALYPHISTPGTCTNPNTCRATNTTTNNSKSASKQPPSLLWQDIIHRGTAVHISYFGSPKPNTIVIHRVEGDPETIIKASQPIVEEVEVESVRWVDNKQLEAKERDLLRKRTMIREYQLDMEAVEDGLGRFGSMDGGVLEVEGEGEGDEEMFDAEGKRQMEGIASRMERRSNGLRRGMTHERRRLDDWRRVLIDAENAFDAVAYDDGFSRQASDKWLSRARDKLHRFVEVSLSATLSTDGGVGVDGLGLDYGGVELFSADNLQKTMDQAYSQIFQEGRTDANRALLETVKGWTEGEAEMKTVVVKNLSIKMADLVRAEEMLVSECGEIIRNLKINATVTDSINTWIKATITTVKNKIVPYRDPDVSTYTAIDPLNDPDNPITTTHRLLHPQIHSIINTALETEHADHTDRTDYATVRSGGRIIRTGPRRTTPSVSSNMPLLNRLLSSLNLRFYGHRAESALNPTYPPTAIGQCWSVEREGTRKDLWGAANALVTLSSERSGREGSRMKEDSYRGEYATLAVRLARSTRVEEVVVEHPPEGVLGERDTAVKDFRVVGFEDRVAMGHPWMLGSFRYDSGSDRSLQTFSIPATSENGQPLPSLSSIVLAIDSNWGANYTCLYRFRVHGVKAHVAN